MTEDLSCHNVLVILLIVASVIVNSECRPLTPEEDWNLQRKSVLELSSRDEIVQMTGYGEEKLSTALITGSLLCYKNSLAASERHSKLYPQPISGALVGAICTNQKGKRGTWVKAVTDEYGEFIIDLPSHLHAIPKLDHACSVRTLQVPKNSSCYRSADAPKQTKITLSSHGNGVRTYTTGIIALVSKVSQHSEA